MMKECSHAVAECRTLVGIVEWARKCPTKTREVCKRGCWERWSVRMLLRYPLVMARISLKNISVD